MSDWQRLSPRMLLVHPVHEALRQLPLLISSFVLGSATGNPLWALLGLGFIVAFGLARWFTTTYRIDEQDVQLRTGVLQRNALSVPRNRIRSVQTDARLLHRLLGLTVLRVSTGQEAHGDKAFELDAVEAEQVPRLRAILLAGSSPVPAEATPAADPVAVLARWQPSWLRYSPLSWSGLLMLAAAWALLGQAGLGEALSRSRIARSGLDAAQRFGAVASVVVLLAVIVLASVLLAVGRSLLTYGNLVLTRVGQNLHLTHGLLRVRERTFDMRRLRGGTLREPILVRALGGARLDAAMTGVGSAGEASLLLPPCPAGTARGVLAGLVGDEQVVTGPLHPHGLAAARRRWTRALTGPAVLAIATGDRGAHGRCARLGLAGLGGADAGLRVSGGRPGAGAGPPGGPRLAGGAPGQRRTSPRLHRDGGHHRVDRPPDVLSAARRGRDPDRGNRRRCQALPRRRRPGLLGLGGGRRSVPMGGRQRLGTLLTGRGHRRSNARVARPPRTFTVAAWRSVECSSTSTACS